MVMLPHEANTKLFKSKDSGFSPILMDDGIKEKLVVVIKSVEEYTEEGICSDPLVAIKMHLMICISIHN